MWQGIKTFVVVSVVTGLVWLYAEILRVARDQKEPLRKDALLDDGAAALARAGDHLLVREHRVA